MKIDKEELHAIFNGIANDDETQFNLLYERYNKLVYQVAFSILKNRENSEDVAQKVFLKIWKLDKVKLPTCNEASWLYSLSKNETLNYLRTKKEEVDIEDIYYRVEENEELDKLIDKDTYNRTISRLNSDEQEIVSLKVLSNLSFREIAQILNIPMGTAQWKYYKSINNLKMLITNLGMFIISIGIFLSERRVRKNKKSVQAELNIKTNVENSIQFTETTKDKDDNERKMLNQTKDSTYSYNRLNEIETNTIESNIAQNGKTEGVTEINSNRTNKLNSLEIGTLVISSVFFAIILLQLIKYVKSWQK